MCEKNEIQRGREQRRHGERAEKEGRGFNNSQTPASFRIESVARLDPRVLHTWHIVRSGCLIQTLCLFCACVQEIAKKKDEGSSGN